MNYDHNIKQRNEASTQQDQDLLTETLQKGAQQLLAQAIETEVETLLEKHQAMKTSEGKQAVTRNGYLPSRTIQTGIGLVQIQVPKVRDHSGQGIKFNSKLVPPYLKRSQNLEEFLPLLYLKGVSSGDFSEALAALTGQSMRVSPNTLSRLKKQWQDEHQQWRQRSLKQRYLYLWADGVYFHVRSDDHRQCILVVIGVRADGVKELLAVETGYRESEASWYEVFEDLRQRGLQDPELITADGLAGLLEAAEKVFPQTRHQRCWVHKTANVLNKLPKSMQAKMKQDLHEIWMAADRETAEKALARTLQKYEAKYPKVTHCLQKDRDVLLTFYDFPAEHWQHIRTTNPIESTFATVRLRTDKTRNCVSRETILAMVFKLTQSAETRWRKIRGFRKLGKVIEGVPFKDGIEVTQESQKDSNNEQQEAA